MNDEVVKLFSGNRIKRAAVFQENWPVDEGKFSSGRFRQKSYTCLFFYSRFGSVGVLLKPIKTVRPKYSERFIYIILRPRSLLTVCNSTRTTVLTQTEQMIMKNAFLFLFL